MQVIGDRFHFIDNVANTVKLYRSPGVFVWETDRLPNLHYLAVSPDGTAYAAWGTRVDCLSCFDRAGELLWTVRYGDLLSAKILEEMGAGETYGNFGWLTWTGKGLVSALSGLDKNGEPLNLSVVIDREGRLVGSLPGSIVSPEGVTYTVGIGDRRNKFGSMKLVARDEKGAALREVCPKFDANGRSHLAGTPTLSRVRALPTGGFAIEGFAHLPKPVPIAHSKTVPLEEVLWRLDSSGNVTEEWRFPTSLFAGRYRGTVVGSDGCVYRLVFGDTGIDVVKYSETGK